MFLHGDCLLPIKHIAIAIAIDTDRDYIDGRRTFVYILQLSLLSSLTPYSKYVVRKTLIFSLIKIHSFIFND